MTGVTLAAIIAAGLFLGLIAAAWLVQRHADSSQGRWLDDQWADILHDLNGPAEYDGTTWDLPAIDAGWFTPSHDPETVSFGAYPGPDPEYDAGQLDVDIEAYIERMRAETTQFIEQLHAMA